MFIMRKSTILVWFYMEFFQKLFSSNLKICFFLNNRLNLISLLSEVSALLSSRPSQQITDKL